MVILILFVLETHKVSPDCTSLIALPAKKGMVNVVLFQYSQPYGLAWLKVKELKVPIHVLIKSQRYPGVQRTGFYSEHPIKKTIILQRGA